jgi:hypothetical protein
MYTVKIAKNGKLRITFRISQRKSAGILFLQTYQEEKTYLLVYFFRVYRFFKANLPIAIKNYMQSCKCHSFFDVCACKARKPQTRAI